MAFSLCPFFFFAFGFVITRRGKQAFKRNIAERETDYASFETEFGHLEGDTIVVKSSQIGKISVIRMI